MIIIKLGFVVFVVVIFFIFILLLRIFLLVYVVLFFCLVWYGYVNYINLVLMFFFYRILYILI